MSVRLLVGDCRETLRTLEAGSVQCVVTSPPYYGLRSYVAEGDPLKVFEIGLEPTPELWIEHLVEVFREVRRVLRDDGTVWLNIGSSYFGGGQNGAQSKRQGFVGDDGSDPNLSQPRGRVPAYDIDDTGRSGSPDPDFAYSDLCGECRAVLSNRIAGRLPHHPAVASQPVQIARDNEHQDSGPMLSAVLPLASPKSTTLRSSPQPPGACSHCDNCGACLSALRSSTRDARLCVRTVEYKGGTTASASTYRISGMDAGASAQGNSTIASHPYKPKDDMLLPARLALALQADGWWIRSQIPWLKRSAMPESVTDRPASSVEYVYLLSKNARYFYDPDAVRIKSIRGGEIPGGNYRNGADAGVSAGWDGGQVPANRNRRNSDWFMESWQGLLIDEDDSPIALVVNPAPYRGAHFATWPPKLVEPMIKASSSERGQCPTCGAPWVRVTEHAARIQSATGRTDRPESISVRGQVGATSMLHDGKVGTRTSTGWRPSCAHLDLTPVPQTILDPFGGSGCSGLVADRLGRNAILCELNPEYGEQAVTRVTSETPMFTEIESGTTARSTNDPITDTARSSRQTNVQRIQRTLGRRRNQGESEPRRG